ncbi:hypothetical protein Taro_019267 [Colocasia esculenta]|uniref:Uncharacterized protein n=1 Tax=Colocasia esculenta TaxID=4460 RepID=A0A843V1M8_COLES|nr:hypothetical protein [Colocasia esculenta]
MPDTSRDPGPELSRVRHWKRTSWGPVRLLVSVPPTTSALQVTKDKHNRTCNSNTGVRVSRSDDTDLDGTTQVPGQSPELAAWLTKNLGHPTGENLPQSPGSHRTLRELPQELHHVTAFPRTIWQRHAFYDLPTTLQYLLEALGTRGQQAGAREKENRVENLPSGDPITCRILRLASTPMLPRTTATLNVHIQCRQYHAVNVHLPRRQSVNGYPWPPTPTELQQVGVNPYAAKNNRHSKRPHPMPPISCSQCPLTWTPISQRLPLAANSN